jgi:hypothetical protein
MPQGLQVWDASGTLIIDTSTYVLKSISTIVAPANTTALQQATVVAGGATNIIVASAAFQGGSAPQDAVAVNYNAATNKVQYQFKSTGSYSARINTLAF